MVTELLGDAGRQGSGLAAESASIIPTFDLSIVLYEDDPRTFVELRQQLLVSGMHIAGRTHEPNRLASLTVTLRPDLVILGIGSDLRLDARLAKHVFGQQAGLVVLQRPRPEVGDLLLSHGAAGCLALPLAPASLWAAMVAVLRGLVVLGRGCTSASAGRGRAKSLRPPLRPVDARMLLTPSEGRVMTLVAAGYRSLDIAIELNLSVGTVKNRLSTAYARLGARNRAEAAAAWSAATITPVGPRAALLRTPLQGDHRPRRGVRASGSDFPSRSPTSARPSELQLEPPAR